MSIRGTSFLRYMVRKIIGTLLQVGADGFPQARFRICWKNATALVPDQLRRLTVCACNRWNIPILPLPSASKITRVRCLRRAQQRAADQKWHQYSFDALAC